ncbi:MAG: hypothetical protein ACE364_01085 [Chlorobiota bacterium]
MDSIISTILSSFTDGDSKRVFKTAFVILIIVIFAIPSFNYIFKYDRINQRTEILSKLSKIKPSELEDERLIKTYSILISDLNNDDTVIDFSVLYEDFSFPSFLSSFWFFFTIYLIAIINAKFKSKSERIIGTIVSFVLIIILSAISMFIPYYGYISFIINPIFWLLVILILYGIFNKKDQKN